LRESVPNLRGPCRLDVWIHFVVEALDQLTSERGTLFVRELKGLSEQSPRIHG
jgi:hypothetical protein